MAHDVFISHSSKDKVMADAICAGLESRGIRCWIAPRDVQPGEEWTKAIVDAVTGCKVFLLVFTTNSNSSSQIVKEVDCATRDQKTIIPFRIEDIDPTGSMKYYLGSLHWLDALTTPIDNEINHLGDYIEHIIGFPQGTQVAIAPKAIPIEGDEPESLKISPRAQKLLQQAAIRKVQEQKKLNRWVIVACIMILLIFAVIAVGGALSDAATNKTPTQRVVVKTTVIEKTHTPTNEPSLTITTTATQGIISAVLLKKAKCRLSTDENTRLVALLKEGDTITILGKNDSGDWINVKNVVGGGISVTDCWVYILNDKVDSQIQAISLPVFTPRPAGPIMWWGDIYITGPDGSKFTEPCIISSNQSEVILDCEAKCKVRTAEGNSCTYELTMSS
jgi:hypothetical protein